MARIDHRLTIVLTLKDRSAFTYRWMQYMNDVRCPYAILIADGGSDPDVATRLQQPGNYPDLSYTYLRYPFDADYPAYYLKLADAVARVTSPYVLLADNDDFVLLEPVPAFLQFLDEHGDYVSCGGTPISLRLESEDRKLLGSPTAPRYVALVDQKAKEVADAAAVDRLCYFMTHVQADKLWSAWYQVHRTAAVNRAVAVARELAFADPVSFEMHVHQWLLSEGKYHHVDAPCWVAQVGSSQLTAELNARANLIERFTATNALGDLNRSLQLLQPAIPDADRARIHKATAQWFAGHAATLYPRPRATSSGDPVERLYRLTRRLLRPLAAMFRQPPIAPREIRLPLLEKHILDR